MATFIATMSYELHPSTDPDSRKLLRAELVGRRWQDRFREQRMPTNTVWARRTAEETHTTDDVHAACAEDLRKAVAAVAGMGRSITVVRAWIQVSGAGTYGPAPLDPTPGGPAASGGR